MSKKEKEAKVKESALEAEHTQTEGDEKQGETPESPDNEGNEENIEPEGPITDLDEALLAVANLQGKLQENEAALEEERNQVLRLNADFINFRKRKEKEMSDTVRFANQELLKQILPVLDDFDRMLKAIDKTDNLTAVKDGILLVSKNLRKHLAKVGLEPIDSIGKTFNTELHEAITTIPVDEEKQKGTVIDEVEKGYKLKDRVIRFSKVVVGE